MKMLIWQVLLDSHLCRKRSEADILIRAGKVFCDGTRICKPNTRVTADSEITIKRPSPYVSRGGIKMEGAISGFGINVRNKIAVDLGCSTGGFTHCLLNHRAKKVYSVDVGYGVLDWKMRTHPKVEVYERTNISDSCLLELDPKPQIGVIDLSYLSLSKAIPAASKIVTPRGDLICLVKPLFEIQDSVSRRKGVIADPDEYRKILSRLAEEIMTAGHTPAGIINSPITGSKGSKEFFIHIQLNTQSEPDDLDTQIDSAVLQNTVL